MSSYDTPNIAVRWDAGEAGCGQLAAGVAKALSGIQMGQSLMLTTRDAGAPIDIPAWCRLVGHTLVSSQHPIYIICKKGDQNV